MFFIAASVISVTMLVIISYQLCTSSSVMSLRKKRYKIAYTNAVKNGQSKFVVVATNSTVSLSSEFVFLASFKRSFYFDRHFQNFEEKGGSCDIAAFSVLFTSFHWAHVENSRIQVSKMLDHPSS